MSDTGANTDSLRDAPEMDQEIGVEYYASQTDGVGGHIKERPADFRVDELSSIDPEPLEADVDAYPHLIVSVELAGWDTHDFVKRLSNALGVSRGRISWAGTKDKHAVSTQYLSIRAVSPDLLPTIRNTTITPIGRFGRSLSFGDVTGNRFDITVRDSTHPDHHEDITAELETFGGGRVMVPNYFGHQRFGSRRPITHRVGLEILRGDWKGAVGSYLWETGEQEPEETREFRTYVHETQDWDEALKRCPRYLGFERTLLHGIVEHEQESDPFRAALDRLPRTLCQLFVHATQSYLFNRLISRRLSSGLPLTQAVAGDVVCFGTHHSELGTVPDLDALQRVDDSRVDTINRHIDAGRAWVTGPLIGHDTSFASGVPGDLEMEVLEEFNLTRADFSLPEPYDSAGTRRPLVVRTAPTITTSPLRFQFALPSGSYATVLMREYIKGPLEAFSESGDTGE